MARPRILMEDFADMLNFTPEQEKMASSVQSGGMMEMEFSKMESFPDHKFKRYEGQQLADMVESVKQLGILLPIILWHTKDGKYTILSGHNRRNAGQLAGLSKGPVIVKENLTHEDAVLIVTETNLRQRSFADLSHSERAYCLKEHYEALKCQGKRSDLLNEIEKLLNPNEIMGNQTLQQCDTKSGDQTLSQYDTRLRTTEKVGNEYGLSHAKVARYIRISSLIPPLIKRVDAGEIAFLAAYDLSFIKDKIEQQKIADLLESDGYKIDMKKAQLLRDYYEGNKLADIIMMQILSGEKSRKPKSNKPQPIKIKSATISKYFKTGESPKEIELIIEKALDLFFSQQNDMAVD